MKKSTSSPDYGCAAGIYTSPILLLFDSSPFWNHLAPLDKLEGFVSKNGRAFYKREVASTDGNSVVRLRKHKASVRGTYTLKEVEVETFWSGKDLEWEIDYQG